MSLSEDHNFKPEVLGLLGHKISYSLSPLIHRTAASYFNKEIQYNIFDVKENEIPKLLKSFWLDGGLGLNVTAPFKRYVADLLSCPQPVNTLYRGINCQADITPQTLMFQGTSTDAQGLFSALLQLKIDVTSCEKILFLGCGDVVISILHALAPRLNLKKKVVVLRRSEKNDATLRGVFNLEMRNIHAFSPGVFARIIGTLPKKSLVVQGASAPHQGDDLRDYADVLMSSSYQGALIDLCYQPHSQLIPAARALGLSYQNGLPMLIEQARASQVLWWGESAPYDILWQRVMKECAARE